MQCDIYDVYMAKNCQCLGWFKKIIGISALQRNLHNEIKRVALCSTFKRNPKQIMIVEKTDDGYIDTRIN